MPKAPNRDDPPAWPLGCVLTILNLLLMVSMSGLLGILLAARPWPTWLAVGLPSAAALLVPVAELAVGLWLRRGRNPYAGQALIWGFALTLALIAILSRLFAYLDHLAGVGR
jgi:hypothetical protein